MSLCARRSLDTSSTNTPDVMSFWLAPESGAPAPHLPGQYVSVAVELPRLGRQIRQYSLSSAPGTPELRITVKLHRAHHEQPAGMVSTHLYDRVHPGDVLEVSPPFGDLALPDNDAPPRHSHDQQEPCLFLNRSDRLCRDPGNSQPLTPLELTDNKDPHPPDRRI